MIIMEKVEITPNEEFVSMVEKSCGLNTPDKK